MKIIVTEDITMRPNGDRDTNRHPSSAFTVFIEGDDGKRVSVFHNDQYDRWWVHIDGLRIDYLNEANKKAEELSRLLGAEIVGIEVTSVEKRLMELHDIIKDAHEEIRKLGELSK